MTTDRKTVVLATAVLLASWLMSDATSRPQVTGSTSSTVTARDAKGDVAIDRLTREVSEETWPAQVHGASEPEAREQLERESKREQRPAHFPHWSEHEA